MICDECLKSFKEFLDNFSGGRGCIPPNFGLAIEIGDYRWVHCHCGQRLIEDEEPAKGGWPSLDHPSNVDQAGKK